MDGTVYLESDVSGPEGESDCYVDSYDIAELCLTWLECTDPAEPECDQYLSKVYLVDAGFESGTDSFIYYDDIFGTSNPGYASGGHMPSDGYMDSGGIHVLLGTTPASGQMSGGWQTNFVLDSVSDVTIVLRYKMVMGDGYENDEYSEVIAMINAQKIGGMENNSLLHINGDDMVSGVDDRGWRRAVLKVNLISGSHALKIGAYNNKSNAGDEYTEVIFDDIIVWAQ